MKNIKVVGTIIALLALIGIMIQLFTLMPPVERDMNGVVKQATSDPTFIIILFEMVIFAMGGSLYFILKKFAMTYSSEIKVKDDSTMNKVMSDLKRKEREVKRARAEIWAPLGGLLFIILAMGLLLTALWPDFSGQYHKVLEHSMLFCSLATVMLFGTYLSDKK